MNTTARRVSRPLMITALAGALIGAPTAAMAASYDETLTTTATYESAGTGWDGVINGRAAGTNVLKVGASTVETFCVQYSVPSANSGTFTSTSWNDSELKGLPWAGDIAARHNEIPGKLADQRSENAAAQLAIWHFTDGVNITTVPNPEIVNRANTLIGAARASVQGSGTISVTAETSTKVVNAALETSVAVLVSDEQGAPMANVPVLLTPDEGTLSGIPAVVQRTDATGHVTFAFVPEGGADEATLTVEAPLKAGALWAPADDLQIVMSASASSAQFKMPAPIDLINDVVVPAPEAPAEEAPVAAPVAEAPAAAEPTVEAVSAVEAKPSELPHTGALGTPWAVAGLLAMAAAAGVTAWKVRSRA